MIIQTNLSKDELIRIKDIKMSELAVVLTGSMIDHIVLRCEIGLISLSDPNICIHKTVLEQKALDVTCRVLREDETIILVNKNTKPVKQFVQSVLVHKDVVNSSKRKYKLKGKAYNAIPTEKLKEVVKQQREGYKLHEIAELQKVSIATVSLWLKRGKALEIDSLK
jgi:methyl coenzyme M reductase subunit C